jgi:hypothetical protein
MDRLPLPRVRLVSFCPHFPPPPRLLLLRAQINFGNCFLRYPYVQNIVISNDSEHPARYEILPQDEHSAVIAEFTAEMPRGSIEPRSQLSVPITLVGDRLGKVNIPLLVRISGTDQPPMKATVEVCVPVVPSDAVPTGLAFFAQLSFCGTCTPSDT